MLTRIRPYIEPHYPITPGVVGFVVGVVVVVNVVD
jgi:hypothetical protein